MKSLRDPRVYIALILLFLAVAFLGGTLRLIHRAQAASASIPTSYRSAHLGDNPEARVDTTSLAATPVVTEAAESTPGTTETPADTTGIIALAFVIVAAIILGAGVGLSGISRTKKSAK